MRNDLLMAINQICAEKSLQREVVIEAIEAALVSAYKRNFGAAGNVLVKIDQDSGQLQVFSARQVVEVVADNKNEITLNHAKALDKDVELGGTVHIETTPANFGRIAAQTAKQVILQRIREAEREATYKTFADRENEIVSGVVQRIDYTVGDVIIGLERGEAVLPKVEQIPNERYRVNGRIRAYLVEVHRGTRGPMLKLSRTHRNMLRRLLELEVPEISNGTVEIKSIAREPGQRSKVAVAATQFGVDPVGSCVGMRGVRIQNIVNELNGEKIDVVEWSPDIRTFITNALSPAKVNEVYLDDHGDTKTAIVVVPDRQLSLAIGKEGQNARLGAKLTGWRIDIKSETDAARENLAETFIERARQALAPERDILALAEQILREREGTQVAPAETVADYKPDDVERRAFDDVKPVEAAKATAEEAALEGAAEDSVPAPAPAPVAAEPLLAEQAATPEAEVAEAAPAAEGAQAAETAKVTAPETEWVAEDGTPWKVDDRFGTFFGDKPFGYEEVESADTDESGQDRKRKRDKKTRLVFDEDRGEVVSVRRRKRSRRTWEDFDELGEDLE